MVVFGGEYVTTYCWRPAGCLLVCSCDYNMNLVYTNLICVPIFKDNSSDHIQLNTSDLIRAFSLFQDCIFDNHDKVSFTDSKDSAIAYFLHILILLVLNHLILKILTVSQKEQKNNKFQFIKRLFFCCQIYNITLSHQKKHTNLEKPRMNEQIRSVTPDWDNSVGGV